jgi:putative hydroxymethylpyrimidine transport system substrate-binding protein
MKRLTLLIPLLCLLLAACGEKQESVTSAKGSTQSVSLMLDWFPNADHVGIYQAIAEGYFAQAGLNVHVEVPSNVADPLQLVAAGRVDAAITYEPEVFLARNQNEPVVSVAALVQEPLTSIISIGKKPIRSPAQLAGKTVGDAGISYQHAYLETILAHAGVAPSSVKEIDVGSNLVPALVSGRVNAILGGYWNYEAIELQQMHKHPVVIRMNRVGVPTYDELVLATSEQMLENHPDVIRRLVQAIGRGYESVRSDPSAAVANLVHANPTLNQRLQLASVKATLPAYFPSDPSDPWGFQDQTQWNAYGQWMMSNHLISNPAAVANASTNEELAGQGL